MELIAASGLLGLIFFLLVFVWRRQNLVHDNVCRLQIYLENHSQQIERMFLESRGKDENYQQQIRMLTTILKDTQSTITETLTRQLADLSDKQLQRQHSFAQRLQDGLNQHRAQLDERQIQNMKILQESLQQGMENLGKFIKDTLIQNSETMSQRIEKLTQDTDNRLKEISGQVEKRLMEGFEKTTATFTDIVKRLAIIDSAQQKITELSSNVISLQEVLADKRARGAFGEVQLENLVKNVLPPQAFAMQYTLQNGKRADCVLFLPDPTGTIAIDSKFPLENFQRLADPNTEEQQRKQAEQLFKADIKKHIQDIASKYIISGQTGDGAVMFIPAEAVFAEIHCHYPDLVELAQKSRVWLASPTTMMAILTTASAVLKDDATRKQIHIIQEHLQFLGKDFQRFRQRMENLARHINQAHQDMEEVNTSAKKICNRFERIEQVELDNKEQALLEDEL